MTDSDHPLSEDSVSGNPNAEETMSAKPMSAKKMSAKPISHHQPRKRFGQNFLRDAGIIDKIVAAVAGKPEQILVEIGPGRGALTGPLLRHCPHLTVIELDRDLAAELALLQQSHPNLRIIQADALEVDFADLLLGLGSVVNTDTPADAAATNSKLRIVGNLPYNISTPLIFHLLQFQAQIADMHFMLQKEVVDRLAAEPGSKRYGRLSVMVQYSCQVQPLFSVPASCFFPAPKVESAIVRLIPHQNPPTLADNFELFQQVVNVCFQQRRKILRNSLRQFVDDNKLDELGVDTSIRPDTMAVADFVSLSNRLNQLSGL